MNIRKDKTKQADNKHEQSKANLNNQDLRSSKKFKTKDFNEDIQLTPRPQAYPFDDDREMEREMPKSLIPNPTAKTNFRKTPKSIQESEEVTDLRRMVCSLSKLVQDQYAQISVILEQEIVGESCQATIINTISSHFNKQMFDSKLETKQLNSYKQFFNQLCDFLKVEKREDIEATTTLVIGKLRQLTEENELDDFDKLLGTLRRNKKLMKGYLKKISGLESMLKEEKEKSKKESEQSSARIKQLEEEVAKLKEQIENWIPELENASLENVLEQHENLISQEDIRVKYFPMDDSFKYEDKTGELTFGNEEAEYQKIMVHEQKRLETFKEFMGQIDLLSQKMEVITNFKRDWEQLMTPQDIYVPAPAETNPQNAEQNNPDIQAADRQETGQQKDEISETKVREETPKKKAPQNSVLRESTPQWLEHKEPVLQDTKPRETYKKADGETIEYKLDSALFLSKLEEIWADRLNDVSANKSFYEENEIIITFFVLTFWEINQEYNDSMDGFSNNPCQSNYQEIKAMLEFIEKVYFVFAHHIVDGLEFPLTDYYLGLSLQQYINGFFDDDRRINFQIFQQTSHYTKQILILKLISTILTT